MVGPFIRDAGIPDLPDLLAPGDVLVVNDTRVVPARLRAWRATGGKVEVLVLGFDPGPVPALVRPARRLKEGEVLAVDPEGEVRMVRQCKEPGTWLVETRPEPAALLSSAGHVPIPPYLRREDEPVDRERYQTVFADRPGAVAAPTAGLHLTPGLLDRIRERGVEVAALTLHAGPGTFQDLRPADLDRGALHAEWYEVPQSTAAAIDRCRARGGRVVAVGTTTCRALETAAEGNRVRPGAGATTLFIREGYPFQVVDRLLTNFHLPRSSLLMLVCAFGGRARVLAAYAHAIAERYRFYSYGDAMLLDRA